MRPGFLDAVAFVLAGAICGTVLLVGNVLPLQQSVQRPDPLQQFVNPFGPPLPVRKTPPAPPPAPYTVADCESHVCTSNEAPQSDYIAAFCKCFTPQRAAIGPINLTHEQSQILNNRMGAISGQCQRQGLESYLSIFDLRGNYRRKIDADCATRSDRIFGDDSRRGKNDDLCRCVGDQWKVDIETMASALAGAGYYTTSPTFLDTVNQCRKIVFPLPSSVGWQIAVDSDLPLNCHPAAVRASTGFARDCAAVVSLAA